MSGVFSFKRYGLRFTDSLLWSANRVPAAKHIDKKLYYTENIEYIINPGLSVIPNDCHDRKPRDRAGSLNQIPQSKKSL
jgi:hypothetical protein